MTRPIAQNSQSAQILALGLAGAIAMAAAMGFGRFSYTPILPGMMAGLHLSASDAGLIAAANFAGYLAGAILAAFGWATGRERSIALLALAANAALLVAMGISSSFPAFMAIRFLAGVMSAFALIFTTSVVLGHPLAAQGGRVQAIHFGGVGLGIATSSLMVMLLSTFAGGGADNWRLDWLVGAGFAAFATLVAWRFLPAGASRAAEPVVEPPLEWKLPHLLITLS
jgi:MFS family permease